jgi:hypothetical protein
MRTRRALALGLLLTVALAGCGSKEEGGNNNVATAGGTPTAASSAGSGNQQEQAVKYTECLRQHGIEVADPENGQVPAIQQGSASKEKIDEAMNACKQYLPTMPNRKLDTGQVEQLRQVAQCLRQNGFPDFPDPDPNQGGIVIDDSAGIDTKSEAFKQAQQKCGMNQPPPSGGAPQAGK